MTMLRPPRRAAAARRGQAQRLGVEQLGDSWRDRLLQLIDADPYVNVVASARVRSSPTFAPSHVGGHLLGVRSGDDLVAGAYSGGNLLPIGGDDPSWRPLAESLARRNRVCSSIVGRADAVGVLWPLLEPRWGPARMIRDEQPLLVLGRPGPSVRPHPGLRAVRAGELDAYLPAAAAMFTEELGVSPLTSVSAASYRRRLQQLITTRRAFAVFDDDGRVAFKADIGAASPYTSQVQGVWVRPDLRGQGLGTAALAGVLHHALRIAPTVSLYVNAFNVAARRMYGRLGMCEVATLSTILF